MGIQYLLMLRFQMGQMVLDSLHGLQSMRVAVRSSFVLDEHPQIVDTFRFRLVARTPITIIDRPGWFVDRLHVSNDGYAPGAWFHGNLNGEYAADANAALVMEADLSSVTGPMVLQYAADFDMEGDIYDNWHVEMSTDGINWTGITPLIGLPGHGVYVNGTTIIDDSNGWVSLQHAIPNGYNTSVSLRFRFNLIRLVVLVLVA